MIANFPPMDTLDPKKIDKGKRLLGISLGILAGFRLVMAILMQMIVEDTVAFDQFDEVFWLMIPVLGLMGAAVYRGGKAVRYILCGLLVVAVVLEVYLFALAGFPTSTFMLVSILAWLATAFLLYVIMLSEETEEFFLYQRSKNYGEYAAIRSTGPANGQASGGTATSTGQSSAKDKKKKEKPQPEPEPDPLDDVEEDYLSEGEEFVEEEPAASAKGKKKKKKASWDDELDLFE